MSALIVIDNVISAQADSYDNVLKNFIQHAEQVFSFPELVEGDKREKLWIALYNIAQSTKDKNILKNCFMCIRILSREKNSLHALITDEWLDLIKIHSGLGSNNFSFDNQSLEVALEAQKSLCNITFNSLNLAKKCCENGILEGIIKRIKLYKTVSFPDDLKFFDIKLVFLLTAMCPQVRTQLRNESLNELIELLTLMLQEATQNHKLHKDLPPVFLTNKQVDLVCELLKALFNLTVHLNEETETINVCTYLIEILRNYLLISTEDLEKTWALRNNVINLLTNMPDECFKALLIPIQEGHKVPNNLQFEDQNMTAIYEILMFLSAKFNDTPTVSKQHEILSPVVTVLLKGASSHRSIRKFLRIQILPHLRDVHSRPEQGSTIRNHLCRMLTTPITQLRDLVAELLFVLCKMNVGRMIKYTGYGNAAGLFAQRGLLAGGYNKDQEKFSSDSDSETEEYADHKHGINPVLGCYEEPHPNVMENMTEEQKEYEAMKLVHLMDGLLKCGTIKPCTIGADGKPQAIEHVLQLQDGLKAQQVQKDDSDSE